MLIFLYGEDDLRSYQKVKEIKNKFLNSDKAGSGLSVFDFREKITGAGLLDVLGMPNLLAPKRLVIAKNLILEGADEEKEKIGEYLKKNSSSLQEDKDLVVVFWEGVQPKKSDGIYKFLEKNSKAQNFEKLSGIKINSWILKRLAEIDQGSSISRPALEKLVAYAGNDMHILDNEIRKLLDYASGKGIAEEDVEQLVRADIDSNIFATVDALGAKNKKLALRLIHEHLEKGDDPFYLLSMIVYQFRNMIKVADLSERGIHNEHEISKLAKLHPFVVKKTLGQLRSFDYEKLRMIYQKLADLDMKVKTGGIDIVLALDKFIVEL